MWRSKLLFFFNQVRICQKHSGSDHMIERYSFPKTNRYIWFKRTRKSSWMPRESVACAANIHIIALSGCTIEVWWIAFTNTRTTTDLPGKNLTSALAFIANYCDWTQSLKDYLLIFIEILFQIGKEMLTIKSKDGAEFNLLLELLRGEHWQFCIS